MKRLCKFCSVEYDAKWDRGRKRFTEYCSRRCSGIGFDAKEFRNAKSFDVHVYEERLKFASRARYKNEQGRFIKPPKDTVFWVDAKGIVTKDGKIRIEQTDT